jgi:TonB-linked SusC/RagA family outer membrane protein
MQKKKLIYYSYCFLFMILLSVRAAFAQAGKINVTGTVLDEAGEGIVGASVFVTESNQGTVTDVDGKFTVSVNPNAVLQISYLGYVTQKVNVNNRTDLKITLIEDSKTLGEVVVTAMGISRDKKSLPYAMQRVDTESLTESRGNSVLDMLTGKASGVQVTSTGALGSTRIVIRGNNSLTGNNQPLYVVDGIPTLNQPGEDGDLDFGNIINSMNPDEIENIEILKGANASALYGSDAANGVILITTKKASKKTGTGAFSNMGISYGLNIMLGSLYSFPTYQNIYGAGQNGRFQRREGFNYFGNSNNGVNFNPDLPYGIWNPNQGNQDNRSWGMPMLGFDVVGRNGEVKKYVPQESTIEDMYQTATTVTNSFSLEKVLDKATLRLGYTNVHGDDILGNFNLLDRHNFSLRSTAEITNFLDIDANVRYVYENVDNRGFRNNSSRNPLYVISSLPRDASVEELIPWKQPDGRPYNFRGFTNPYWLLNETSNEDDKHWFTGNLTFNIKLNRMFRVRVRAATDVQTSKGWAFTNLYSTFDEDGEYTRWNRTATNNNYDGLVSFNNRFNDKFNLSANLGTSLQKIETQRMDSKVNMLQFPDVKSLSNSKGIISALGSSESKEKQAIFGMTSLGYNDWLFLDLTARNEWSSTLPKANNSYFYYSLGSSIILTDLFQVNKKVLSFWKLRGSYAQVGNDTGFDRLYSGYYKPSDGTFLESPYYMGDDVLKNPNLKPETTESWEFGTEIRLWNGRVNADFTYYTKGTKDQIVEADAPLASGYRREIINAGKIRNNGVELSVTLIPIETKLITWTTTVNWSKNNSKVLALTGEVTRYEMQSADNIKLYAEVGKPYGVFYGNDYKRNEKGEIYVAMDGKAMFEPDRYLGPIQADWFGGWQNTLRIGNVHIGASIDFQKGGRVWSHTAYRGGIDGSTVQSLEGRWEFTLSELILGESDLERRGMLAAAQTVKPGANEMENFVAFPDGSRPKGVWFGNTVYDEAMGEFWYNKESMAWVKPQDHWTHNAGSSVTRYIYDASYIKLREVRVGYEVPKKFMAKTPFQSAKVSLVGTNVAILHQNTPKGLDPQATSTSGNAQGFERGFNLPQANWGFDIKVSF